MVHRLSIISFALWCFVVSVPASAHTNGLLASQAEGSGKTVLLDSWFNNEIKKDAKGANISWHYKWDETAMSGFSIWGSVFNNLGVKTETLFSAPTARNLRRASIYIIVDPDTAQESEHPNFITATDIKAITAWVRRGGVLVLMGNDVGNAELDHLSELAKNFGIEFNRDSRNHVQGDNYATGRLTITPPHEIFTTARNLFLKDLATLKLAAPARPVLQEGGDVIMAVAKFGKGTVFAVGDPWLYNEYTDGKKLPADYDNYKAAVDLTRWLIKQAR